MVINMPVFRNLGFHSLFRLLCIMMRKSDPIDLFMDWYNNRRPHQSPDFENLETPARAFARKMPPAGETVIDEQTGEKYDVRQGGGVNYF